MLSRNAGKDCDRLTLTKSRGCIDGIGCQVSGRGRRRFRLKKCTHLHPPREHGWRSRCCSRSRHTCSPQFLVSPPRPDSASFPPSNKPNTRSPTPLRLPPRSRAASLSLAVRQQNRAKGKRVDRNLRSVCLSCCPPTMIDSLPRSSAIQRRRNGRSNRTTVRAAVFLATPPPHQTRAAIPGSQSLPSPIVYTRRGKPSGQNWNTSGF